MTDANHLAPLINSKLLGQNQEELEHFKVTNTNFVNKQVSSTTREFVSQENEYESCPNCFRKFFSGRLKLHLKSCRDSKPLKPIKKNIFAERLNERPLEEGADNLTASQKSEGREDLTVSYKRVASQEKNLSVSQVKATFENKSNHYEPKAQGDYQALENRGHNNTQDEEGEDDAADGAENGERTKAEDGRVGCHVCGRFFHEDRIAKHEKACKKSNKKRPVFDTTKQRAIIEEGVILVKKASPENTKQKKPLREEREKSYSEVHKEAHKEVQKEGNKDEGHNKENKMPRWKAEHNNFIENIRFNRKVKQMEARGEDTSNLVAPTIINDTYVGCPYCFRKFASATAERHIPKCKNIFNRPKPPKNLRLEKIDTESSKVHFTVKKNGAVVRKSPDVDSKVSSPPLMSGHSNFPVSPTEKLGSHRIPSPKFFPESPDQHTESEETASPKSGTKLPQSNNPKTDSRAFFKKEKQTILPEIKKSEGGVGTKVYEIDISDGVGRDSRSQSPTGGRKEEKKIFSEPLPKKDILLQHYTSLIARSSQYSVAPCPYCQRKFAPSAAERHIPVCKDHHYKNMRKSQENGVMSGEKRRPKMYLTSFVSKISLKNKILENEDSIHPPPHSSHNGSHSTDYEQMFRKQKARNKEKLAPLHKPGETGADAVIEKPSLLQKPKIFSSLAHFCTSCGTKFAQNHKFCGQCGQRKENL